MKGLVGVIANDAARFSEFAACITRLEAPEGWEIEWVIGGDWCGARNSLARFCLEGGYSHLWFMDDDHSFASDLLVKLLAWDKPLVTPMCLTRTFPFVPVSYVELPEPRGAEKYLPIDLAELPAEGLVELAAGGCAGMLIRRDVLEHVPEPWFEYTDRSEDIVFCEKARAAGYVLHGDLGARLAHITTAVVEPSYDEENGWTTGLTVGKDMRLLISRAQQLVTELEPSPEPQPSEERGVGETTAVALVPPPAQAERVEIWVDEEQRWWWRAITEPGDVIARDSGVNELAVIAAANALFPGAPIFQIQRELDDSRKTEQYGPPRRLWNREPT